MLRDILKGDAQVESWVSVVQAADPDVLVVGDLDFDLGGMALAALAEKLEDYPIRFSQRPNRGLHSGRDLDGDGRMGEPEDAEGYGTFSGQGGMGVLSRLPLDEAGFKDHSGYNWSNLPQTLAIGDGRDPARLSTTVHWDLPVIAPDGSRINLLIWHATAPVFDGPEDRNGRRNHDETRFWHLYVRGELEFPAPERFVILGTSNADPFDGESRPQALRALLSDPLIQDARPVSAGAVSAASRDGAVNAGQFGPSARDTVDWPDGKGEPGNLRVDYVLPAAALHVTGSGVFWPEAGALLGGDVARASRHRLVWVDVQMGERLADGG